MTVDERIGRNVHHLLWDTHRKQRALYEALGVSRSALAKKMRGQIAWSASDIDTAARVLGVDAGELFIEVPEQRKAQVTGDNLLPFLRRARPVRHLTLVPAIERIAS